jgi:hypothetical protein
MRLIKALSLLLIIALSWSACLVPERGCLDIEATNYNVSADENCCCTYPSLVLNVSYLAGSVPFNPSIAYNDADGNAFFIRRLALYLSDFGLEKSGQVFKAKDTVLLYTGQDGALDSSLFIGNISLINRSAFSLKVGDFAEGGSFDKLHFLFGLPEEANNNLQNRYQRGHPLFIQIDSMHTFDQKEGYLFFSMLVESAETGVQRRLQIWNNPNSRNIVKPINFTSTRGFDRTISFGIDYLYFLQSGNYLTDSDEFLRNAILSGLNNAFVIP